MTRNYSIAAIIPAYCGADVLPGLLKALQRQTHRLDEIVIVDNASTDHTLNLLARDYPEVTVLNRSRNEGVGGALCAGLEYAVHGREFDWVWLLDQDSVPEADALARLLEGLKHLGVKESPTAILASVCMNPEAQVAYAASTWHHGLQKSQIPLGATAPYFVDSVISSGTLLRREAVEEVGLPRADFFMDFVDHEYCLRIRRHGYKIAVVPSSRLEHAIGNPTRPRILGIERFWTGHAPWREYYKARNEIFTVWNYCPDWRSKATAARRLLRHALAVILFGREKIACLAMMYRGVADGFAGRLGIRDFDGEAARHESSLSSRA